MSQETTPPTSDDPTKLYEPNDPRFYGFSTFRLRLWHGMTTWAWLRLISGHLHHVSPQRYGLVLSVTLMSLLNSIFAIFDKLFFGRRVAQTEFAGDPVLIIGFQRSGTTFLNELLACDDRFGYPDNLQCIMPETFLVTERRLRKPNMILKMDRKRPMDDVDMRMDAPQEDEIALLLSGVPSPYVQIGFPSDDEGYRRALADQNTNERTKKRWRKAWVHFLRRVQFRNPGKRLLLKSPSHTGRVPRILEIFPEAKFIHITRNPYRIYHSNLKLGRALTVTQGFQKGGVDDQQMVDELIHGFRVFHENYEEIKPDIPEGHLVTVSYEDLVADPMAVMRRIYDEIGLGDITPAVPAMEAYLESRKGYKTNVYKEDPDVVRAINENWGVYFDSYGYEMLPVEGETPDVAAPANEDAPASDGANSSHG